MDDDPTRMRDEDLFCESFFASINTLFDVFLMGLMVGWIKKKDDEVILVAIWILCYYENNWKREREFRRQKEYVLGFTYILEIKIKISKIILFNLTCSALPWLLIID